MDVSVVIVNTQTRDLVLACLRHLMPDLQGIEH